MSQTKQVNDLGNALEAAESLYGKAESGSAQDVLKQAVQFIVSSGRRQPNGSYTVLGSALSSHLTRWWKQVLGHPSGSKPWGTSSLSILLNTADIHKVFSSSKLPDGTNIIVKLDLSKLLQLGAVDVSTGSTSGPASGGQLRAPSPNVGAVTTNVGPLPPNLHAQLCALAGMLLDVVLPSLTPAQQELCERRIPHLSYSNDNEDEDGEDLSDEDEDEDFEASGRQQQWGQHHMKPTLDAARHHLQRIAIQEIIERGTVLPAEGTVSLDGAKVGCKLSMRDSSRLWNLVTASMRAAKPLRTLLEVHTAGDPIQGVISWQGTQVVLSLAALEARACEAAQAVLQRVGSNNHETAERGPAGVLRARGGLAALDAEQLQQELARESRDAQRRAGILAMGLVAWCGLCSSAREAAPSRIGKEGQAAALRRYSPLAHITPEGLIKALAAYTLAGEEEGPMELPNCMMASQLGAAFNARMPDVWGQVHFGVKGSKMHLLLSDSGDPCFITTAFKDNIVAQLDVDALHAVAESRMNNSGSATGHTPAAAAVSRTAPAASRRAQPSQQAPAPSAPSASPAPAPAPDAAELQAQTVKLRGMLCCAVCAAYEGDGPLSEMRRLLGLSAAIGGSLMRGGIDGSTLLLVLPAVTAQTVLLTHAQAAGKSLDMALLNTALQGTGGEGIFSVVVLPPAVDQPMLALAVGGLVEASLGEALQVEFEGGESLEKTRVPALLKGTSVLAAILPGGPQCVEGAQAELASQGLVSMLLDLQHAWEEFATRMLGPAPGMPPPPPAASPAAQAPPAPPPRVAQQRMPNPAPAPAGVREAAQQHVGQNGSSTAASSSAPAASSIQWTDSEEEKMALIAAAFAVWPPSAGPDTCVKLSIALAILTPPLNVTKGLKLVRFHSSRQFASKAGCFIRGRMPGVQRYDVKQLGGGRQPHLISQIEQLMVSDPLFTLLPHNAYGNLFNDNDVRLNADALVAAAVELAADGSGTFRPLVWPPDVNLVQFMNTEWLHFQAQEPVARFQTYATSPASQQWFAAANTRLQALRASILAPPAAARAALMQLQKLAIADAPTRPPRFLDALSSVASGRLPMTTPGGDGAAASASPRTATAPSPRVSVTGAAASSVANSAAVATVARSPLAAARALLAGDRDGAALLAACLTAWPFPSAAYGAFSRLSVAAAIIMQPMAIIMQNKGRHVCMAEFALKAIARGITCAPAHQAHHAMCTPAHKLPTPSQILAAEPLLTTHRLDEAKMILDLPRLAAIACAAASAAGASPANPLGNTPPEGSPIGAGAVAGGRLPWPPCLQGLEGCLSSMHQQSQQMVGAFVAVMQAGGHSREQLLAMCLERLSAMSASVPPDQAAALMRAAAASAGPLPAYAFTLPPGAAAASAAGAAPEPVRRVKTYATKGGQSKEEEAAERERLRDAKALLQAQLRNGTGGGTSAAATAAAAAARTVVSKPKVRMFAPGTAEAREAALRSNYGAVYASTSNSNMGGGSGGGSGPSYPQQEQPSLSASSSSAALDPSRLVTSADAYAQLLRQAGVADSDGEDGEEDDDWLGLGEGGVQQDVVFIRGEDGVTMFAVCAGGAGQQDSLRISNARHRGS